MRLKADSMPFWPVLFALHGLTSRIARGVTRAADDELASCISCMRQAYGLVNPAYAFGGMLTGTASDYWNVLWPGASNGAAVGFLVSSRMTGDLRPLMVRRWLPMF